MIRCWLWQREELREDSSPGELTTRIADVNSKNLSADLTPFTLLKPATPLLTLAITLMAVFEAQLLLTIVMMILWLGMGLARPGFMLFMQTYSALFKVHS